MSPEQGGASLSVPAGFIPPCLSWLTPPSATPTRDLAAETTTTAAPVQAAALPESRRSETETVARLHSDSPMAASSTSNCRLQHAAPKSRGKRGRSHHGRWTCVRDAPRSAPLSRHRAAATSSGTAVRASGAKECGAAAVRPAVAKSDSGINPCRSSAAAATVAGRDLPGHGYMAEPQPAQCRKIFCLTEYISIGYICY